MIYLSGRKNFKHELLEFHELYNNSTKATPFTNCMFFIL